MDEQFNNNNNQLYNIHGKLATVQDAESNSTQNRELIQRAMNGEKNAFSELYMLSYQYVYFVVRDYISDDETVYDIIQETFIKVYKGITTLRSPDAYYSWVTTVAKNTAKNFLRTKQYHILIDDNDDYSTFLLTQDQSQKDVSMDIQTVLKELDTQDAELLSLVYYDGMTAAQIAKMRDMPIATVYTRINRAKKKLKAKLAVHGIDKAIYSGNFMSMVTTAIRNIIGTALLSLVIAQQILDSVINGKGKKEIAVAKVIRTQQKKTVLKIASVIVAISMITSAVTALAFTDWNRFKISEDKNNSIETVTEYHDYNEVEKDENSSQDSGGFWGNLFGGDSSDSKNSSDTNTSSNASYSSSQQNKPSTSSSGSDTNSSKNPTANGSTPSNSTPDNSTSTDITHKPEAVVNVFGNNPNNVMTSNQQLDQYETGLVAKQGEWIYFVQQYGRIMKVKTDGSDMQVVFEVSGVSFIECLNVIGDTIYYINGGVWSVKTDGTNRKQHTSKAAHNLLVRGTKGWFVEFINQTQNPNESSYNLYQIDFSTGDITTLVENGVGFGLKTVVGNKMIYANDLKVYSRDLSTGSEEVIFDVATQEQDVPSTINFSIESMIMGSDYNMYIERGTNNTSYGYITYKINLNQPNVVLETYDCFDRIYNYFDHNDGAFFAIIRGSSTGFNFYDLQGNSLCEKDENLHRYTGIYTFDDGYAYYFDENRTALYRMRPDGTGLKIY